MADEAPVVTDVKESKEATTPEKKEKKVKEPKPVAKVNPKSQKANPSAPIDPRTGTRFAPGSARQAAFDIIFPMADEGKTIKEIRAVLEKSRKDAGHPFNLDVGYLAFIVSSHPEMLEAYNNGTIKVIGRPKVDPEAAKKFEDDKLQKKKRAEDAREAKRKAAAEGSAEGGAKKEKKEKKEKKTDGEKPSKKD